MKTSIFAILLIFTFSYTCYASPNIEKFLSCLSNRSSPSFPISEAVYTPTKSSKSFQTALFDHTQNLRFAKPETPKPLAIIAAKHESHVQATVVCAKSNGLQLRIRSGGHDYEGFSYVSRVPFVVIDLFNLRTINIDVAKKTAWVQAGATMGELYYKIARTSKELAFPGGVCPTLGAGGHIGGGGYGNMIRKFGISTDNVIDASIVDVNGKILDRKSMGEDLFWAIRGGNAGGSFGVILSWTVVLVTIPPKVTVLKINRTIDEGLTDIVVQWQNVATKLPREVFIRLQPYTVTQGNKKIVTVTFYCMFLGQGDELLTLVNKNIPKLGLKRQDCLEMSWAESALIFYDLPVGTSINVLAERPKGTSFYSKEKSDYVKTPIPRDGLEKIWKMMTIYDDIVMQWNPYGGIMDDILESATAFPHRKGNLFKIQYRVVWTKELEKNEAKYLSSIQKVYDGMTAYVSKQPRESFLNYRDIDIGSNPSNVTSVKEAEVYGNKYFKNNFMRLMKVKARVDPDNFFKNEQSIPPLPRR